MLETNRRNGVRADLRLIGDLVAPKSRVLDIGCGNGELLQFLQETRGVDGRGIELSQKGVNECVARGLSVIQGDADRDLVHYPDNAFDYVILSQTLQATFRPREVLEQMMRIGRTGRPQPKPVRVRCASMPGAAKAQLLTRAGRAR